jgi:hypothetical protein
MVMSIAQREDHLLREIEFAVKKTLGQFGCEETKVILDREVDKFRLVLRVRAILPDRSVMGFPAETGSKKEVAHEGW